MIAQEYKKMLGAKSVIREMFTYGTERAKEIGKENVFDYSLGNPSVPVPEKFTKKMIELLETESPVALHGYSPSLGSRCSYRQVPSKLASPKVSRGKCAGTQSRITPIPA